MSSLELQASSGPATVAWHSINWAACHRRVRSLQRRIVQAVRAGAWRKAKRLSFLLIHSFAARALAVKRVTENVGKKTPGVDGEVWSMPQLKAGAVEAIGGWRGYRPKPLRRVYISKRSGGRRPLSIPTMEDRARQALYLQALEPMAETLGDPNSYGFRPKRQCADAIDQCFKILRQKNSAIWILEGDIRGFFDNISFDWMLNHIPMNKQVLSRWFHSGFIDCGVWFPTTSGVPQGGVVSPVIGNLVLDGLEKVVQGHKRFRRKHQINFVRYADDFIVTANNREVLEETIIPRINAFLAQRGVALSAEKTKITHIYQGFDFLGQTIRKYEWPNGKPAKLQITPSNASLQAIQAKIKALCKSAAGATSERLIDTLNPVLRGWANYHRHVICAETFARLDNYVWQQVYRWARHRHSNKTGCWIVKRYFSGPPGQVWRFTDPQTGKRLIRVEETVKYQRHVKVKAEANPFDPAWEAYFQQRDRRLALNRATAFKGKVLRQQQGVCPNCRQVIQYNEEVELHHKDGHHQNNRLANLVVLHPNCHRQVHYAPERKTVRSRPLRGVGHA